MCVCVCVPLPLQHSPQVSSQPPRWFRLHTAAPRYTSGTEVCCTFTSFHSPFTPSHTHTITLSHPHRETVSLLLKCGASTTIADSSGSCPLHLAAWKGDIEIVKMLVCQGPSRANVNQQSDSDDTALHLASQYDYSDVVEFLLQVSLCQCVVCCLLFVVCCCLLFVVCE